MKDSERENNLPPAPKNGDILRVNRGLYSHYGVYVSDSDHVIHYTGANGPDDFNGIVRETTLAEFLNGSPAYSVCTFPEHPADLPAAHEGNRLSRILRFIREVKLTGYHLYSGDETVRRARSKLGEGGYNLAFNNCEHFAVWCKTGVKESSQVNRVLDIIASFFDR
ncbi:MAG: lecithin retinol acyltransferase family protein [Synergistaceae bacterium]|nr:lecithin retinol acyltransferase family protein [Synergistaceae bacterium]